MGNMNILASQFQPSVSGLYVDAFQLFLAEHGLVSTEERRVTGPSRLCGNKYAALMDEASRQLGDTGLGIRFGTRIGGAGFGMLGIAAACAPTLRDAIRLLTQLESITSTLGRAIVRSHKDQIHILWHPMRNISPLVVEAILAGWVSFGRFLLDEKVEILQVSMRHGRTASTRQYEDAFNCNVRFGVCCYGVTIAAELLDAKPRFADDHISASLAAWLGHCAAATRDEKSMTRAINNLLNHELSLWEADEPRVASFLGLQRRTMQRILRTEGTSFRFILNAARAQHSILGLMRSDITLPDLTAESGFEEQSSLCRAFRKWTGYAPLAFRQRVSVIFQPLRAQ